MHKFEIISSLSLFLEGEGKGVHLDLVISVLEMIDYNLIIILGYQLVLLLYFQNNFGEFALMAAWSTSD